MITTYQLPFACRLAATLLAIPFVVFIALDIIAYGWIVPCRAAEYQLTLSSHCPNLARFDITNFRTSGPLASFAAGATSTTPPLRWKENKYGPRATISRSGGTRARSPGMLYPRPVSPFRHYF